MYKKILLPLDGSKLAEGVLPYARLLAGKLKVPVELLQVIDPSVISTLSDAKHGRYFDRVETDMRNSSANYLIKIASSFPRASEALYSVLVGKPVEVILAQAQAEADTLITLATRGFSGMQRWALGSTADKILHAATNHVLLIHPSEDVSDQMPLRTVIVPLDGSTLAEKVLSAVAQLAKKMGLEVILLRVYATPISHLMAQQYSKRFEERLHKLTQEAEKYLDSKVKALQEEGLVSIKSTVVAGDAADKIIECAQKTPEIFIAMCTHGRSGLGRWLLGSVTDRVIRNSHEPVLVVRA